MNAGALLAPPAFFLYIYAASFAFVHFRGKVRHRITRQLTDHSTFLAPFNAFIYAFSAVPTRPILNLQQFPELRALMDHWEIIRDEALALRSDGHIKASDQLDDLGFNSFFRRGWKRFYLKWYGDHLPSARQLCPRTVALLESTPTIHGAIFTALPPGGTLVRHRDPWAGSLRFHLGLSTPNDDGCRIFIDGTPYSWRDGEGIVFDETYIHHAENTTDRDRIILFCDVERPMTWSGAAAVNRWLARHVVQLTATRNQDGDPVGTANKLFKYVYQVRLIGKAMKRRSRRGYYAVKYALMALVLCLIFYAIA